MDLGLAYQTVSVIGAARGIGHAVATRLYESGAHVALTDLQGAAEAAKGFSGRGKAFGVEGDAR